MLCYLGISWSTSIHHLNIYLWCNAHKHHYHYTGMFWYMIIIVYTDMFRYLIIIVYTDMLRYMIIIVYTDMFRCMKKWRIEIWKSGIYMNRAEFWIDLYWIGLRLCWTQQKLHRHLRFFFELWIDLGAKNHEDSEPFSLLFNLGCILLKRIAGGSD